ncbi:MAG: ECF transporter S component [Clostridiales bacterium]|nr:ECF transporter S component [Clostridiales bacterium]
MKIRVRELTIAAACLALCLFLPSLTGHIPQYGRALSPMHIPVLICGFLTGWPLALIVGLLAPLLSFFLFSMPPMPAVGLPMMFELAAYGVAASLLYRALPKNIGFLYVSLVLSMLIGRAVWGAVSFIIAGVAGTEFTWAIFFASAFVKTLPGIVVHIAIVPPIVLAVRRALRATD